MQELFEGGCRDVVLKDGAGKDWVRSGRVCWKMEYDGLQKVFKVFDSTQDYESVEVMYSNRPMS
jgi:hypothetical protein